MNTLRQDAGTGQTPVSGMTKAPTRHEELEPDEELEFLRELCQRLNQARAMTDWPTTKRLMDSLGHWADHDELDSFARTALSMPIKSEEDAHLDKLDGFIRQGEAQAESLLKSLKAMKEQFDKDCA